MHILQVQPAQLLMDASGKMIHGTQMDGVRNCNAGV